MQGGAEELRHEEAFRRSRYRENITYKNNNTEIQNGQKPKKKRRQNYEKN